MTPDISKFIDMHTHILPGVDDGPKNLEESAELARQYVELGITQIIATPHFIPGTAWAAGREKIQEKLQEVQNFFEKKKIVLQIYQGMEIAYHKKLISKFENGLLQPLAESKYYLLEPSFYDTPQELFLCAKELMEQGQKVILAHPERIKSFQKTLKPLLNQVQSGVEVQLNTGSILGKFGQSSQQTAMRLIAENSVHYLASDAHAANRRKPLGVIEWEQLSAKLGSELLTTLCITNPNKIILNSYDE